MTQHDVFEFLKAEAQEASDEELNPTPDTRLGDLGLESLDWAGLQLAAEKRFGVKLRTANLDLKTTLANVAQYIMREISAKGQST